jgi:hypothetical protein
MSVASNRGSAGRGTLSGIGSIDGSALRACGGAIDSLSDAPQNRQNCAFLSDVPWQRLHVRVSAGAAACGDEMTTGATPGDGVTGAGMTGAGAVIGVGAMGAARGEPHVMQKRMPGAF